MKKEAVVGGLAILSLLGFAALWVVAPILTREAYSVAGDHLKDRFERSCRSVCEDADTDRVVYYVYGTAVFTLFQCRCSVHESGNTMAFWEMGQVDDRLRPGEARLNWSMATIERPDFNVTGLVEQKV